MSATNFQPLTNEQVNLLSAEERRDYLKAEREYSDQICGDPLYLRKQREQAKVAVEMHVEPIQEAAKKDATPIESNAVPSEPGLVIVYGDQLKPKLVSWLWPNRVAFGKLTLFAGLPGEAKSLCTIDLAATLSVGHKTFGDGESNELAACGTLFLSTEDDAEDTHLPRFTLAGGDPKQVCWLKSKRGPVLDKLGRKSVVEQIIGLDEDLPLVERYLEVHPEIRLVVIDPLSGHLGKVDMNKGQEVRRVLMQLQAMAERRNVAVIFVLHLNKKADLNALQRVSGAGDFIAMARSSWLFTTDEDDEELRLMLPLKNNSAPRKGSGLEFTLASKPFTVAGRTQEFPVIAWGETSERRANDALVPKQSKGAGKLEDAKAYLRESLKSGPRLAAMLIEGAGARGISERTLRTAKEALGVESVKTEQPGSPWEWYLEGCNEGCIDGGV